MRYKRWIAGHVRALLMRLLLALVILQITRYVFLVTNSSHFPNVGFHDHMVGLWFDLITLGLFYLPYYGLILLPIPYSMRKKSWFRRTFKCLYHVITASIIIANLIDTAYFPYTGQRSTLTLFQTLMNTGDASAQLGSYLYNHWWIFVVFLVLFAGVNWLYNKIEPYESRDPGMRIQWISLAALLPLLLIMGRGGLRPRPVGVVDASAYVKAENAQYVLNTPFTMLKRLTVPPAKVPHYMSIQEEQGLFNPVRQSTPANLLPNNTNVVIIVLESFGIEFVGSVSGMETYTPFLDSLVSVSWSFPHAFANGKKSVEALPAIVASIPSLTEQPYMESPYGTNDLNALPEILSNEGYETGFFHGATNGSMRFDAFARHTGFQHYFGRSEYANERHFDGTWGIWDHCFNPWAAQKMSSLKQPFCSLLFTVSSHHPYKIPEGIPAKQGKQEICASISYADYSLRAFFHQARKEPWFNNTLFVIVADHTPASKTKLFNQHTHMFRIPMLFYDPGNRLIVSESDKIAQQLDIFPTVLDLLNIETRYYSYGQSLLQNTEKQSIVRIFDVTYLFMDKFVLTFSQDKAQNLLNFTLTGSKRDVLEAQRAFAHQGEKKLKAILQRYYRDITTNQLRIEQ